MKPDLRCILAERSAYGAWSTIGDPSVVGMLAAPGIDYVVFDLQHGSADESDLPALTSAAVAAGLVPLARVRAPQPYFVSRALDLGAHGVVVPHVNSADIAREVVSACRTAPRGHRSFGRVIGGSDDALCVVMVESGAAVEAVDGIVAVDGVDAVYIGPWDLSLTLGCAPDRHDPVLGPALATVWAACARAGMPVGTHAADGETARAYLDAGCRLVTVVVDSVAIRSATADQLKLVGRR